MTARNDFVATFGGVFEHSPFIAERAYDGGMIFVPLTAKGVHEAMVAVFAPRTRRRSSASSTPIRTLPASSPSPAD